MGDGRAKGSSVIGYGGQAAISRTPDINATGSGSLLVSILSTLLKKKNDPVMSGSSSSCFLVIDDTVAPDCILNSCYNLCVPFYVQVLCLKN